MPTIASATITAFYLFDVAEQIDLKVLVGALIRWRRHRRVRPASEATRVTRYS